MAMGTAVGTAVFDLDGTLVDSLPDLLGACNRFMAARGMAAFTAAEVRPMVGDGAAALVGSIMAARGRVATEADFCALVADYLAHVADETRPFAGVEAGLDRLAAAGWRLAVCTNKPERPARAVLLALGLLDRFAAVCGGDTFAERKPAAAHLLGTIAAAGGDVARAVMVGDHRNDVAAGVAAGVPVVFAGWGYGPPAMGAGARVAAADFADAVAAVERLVG